MIVKPDTKQRLPVGLSPQEEAAWWDNHKDYWDTPEAPDTSDALDKVVHPDVPRMASSARTRPVTIRLPVGMIDALKAQASHRAIPYQTLMRMWLKEQLDRNTLVR